MSGNTLVRHNWRMEGDATGIQRAEAREAAKHPTKHRTARQQNIIRPKMSIVQRLGNLPWKQASYPGAFPDVRLSEPSPRGITILRLLHEFMDFSEAGTTSYRHFYLSLTTYSSINVCKIKESAHRQRNE